KGAETGCDETWGTWVPVAVGAGTTGLGSGGGAGRPATGAWASPGRPSRFLSDISVNLEIPLSVSKTPWPRGADDSKWSQPLRLRLRFISSTVQMSGRSRLLYWSTRGRLSDDRPISAKFSSRLRNDSWFAWSIARCESATKTTPSTPFKTSLRVVL